MRRHRAGRGPSGLPWSTPTPGADATAIARSGGRERGDLRPWWAGRPTTTLEHENHGFAHPPHGVVAPVPGRTSALALAGLALGGTVVVGVAFSLGLHRADSFADNWLLTGSGAAILVSGAASVVAGVVALLRRHDRSWAVLSATASGVLVTALMLQQWLKGWAGWRPRRARTSRMLRTAPDDPEATPRSRAMDMRLELVPLPTTDVDRSKEFYVDRVGFHLDHDVEPGNGCAVVQLTPPGSAARSSSASGSVTPTLHACSTCISWSTTSRRPVRTCRATASTSRRSTTWEASSTPTSVTPTGKLVGAPGAPTLTEGRRWSPARRAESHRCGVRGGVGEPARDRRPASQLTHRQNGCPAGSRNTGRTCRAGGRAWSRRGRAPPPRRRRGRRR